MPRVCAGEREILPFELYLNFHPRPNGTLRARFLGLQGGGLFIGGTATLTNTNVFDNQATLYVCSRSELLDLSSSALRT